MLFTNKHLLTLELDIPPRPSRIDAFPNISVVGRPRPVFDSLDKPVLDRIVMNVIHMPLKVLLVANLMLPKPALPNAPLALAAALRTLVTFGPAGTKIPPREARLDSGPSQ